MSPPGSESNQNPPAPGTSTAALPDLMRRAVACYRAGNLTGAEGCCKEILSVKSDHFDALHLLGAIAAKQGHFEEADRLLGRALEINSRSAEAHADRGNVQKALRRYDDALSSYDRALAIKPAFAAVLNSRGAVLTDLERYTEALASFDLALTIEPRIS